MAHARRSRKNDSEAVDPNLTSALAKASGILDLEASTAAGGEWPTIVDTKNPGSPMVQTSGNGLPTMVFDGTDVYLWPQSPAHSSTTKVGIWFWFKPTDVAGYQMLYLVTTGVAGSSTKRFTLYQQASFLVFQVYTSDNDAREFDTAGGTLVLGAWHSIYFQYDSSRGGDANVAIYVNGILKSTSVSVAAGAGSALGALQAASGSALFGGQTDSDSPGLPIISGGESGPRWYAFNNNLTAAEIAVLQEYKRPKV